MKLAIRNPFKRKHRKVNSGSLDVRMFNAAQHNRLTDWRVSYQRVNGDLFVQWQTITLRCRDLAMNNESVIGLLHNLTRNVIGANGFTLQSKAEPVELRPIIESLWRDYNAGSSKAVAFDGHAGGRDFDMLVLRSLVIDGECFIRKVYDPVSRYGWRYEVIDAMQIDPMYMVQRLDNGGKIFMGIELDARGREVAYYYRPTVDEQYYTGARERLDAKDIIHLFRREFPSQYRGISMLAGAVMNLKQLDDYRTAELIHAQIGSCCMGVWEWNGQNPDDIITDSSADDKGEFVREIKPGIFPIAPRGYSAKFLQNQGANPQFPSFVKNILRSICNSLGLSYNKGSGDYESVNYSSLREASLEDRETFKELQTYLIENWKDIQFKNFIGALIAKGTVRAQSLAMLKPHKFFGRRFQWVDPQKEIKAKKEEMAMMLTDPISELEARGEDPDEVIARFAEWKKKLDEAGLGGFWDATFGLKEPEIIEDANEDDNESLENVEDNND
jgi:lambda family phage portal protein